MISYFTKVLGAHFQSGRVLYLLAVAGVTMGVASVLGIQIINRNATAAFEGTVDAVSGAADMSIVGTGTDLPERTFITALETPGVRLARPMVRADVLLPKSGLWLDIVGVDLLTPFGAEVGISEYLSGNPLASGWVGISSKFAADGNLVVGDSVIANLGAKIFTLHVGQVYEIPSAGDQISRRLAFMDIAQAQSLFGSRGRIHQVDLFFDSTVPRDSTISRLTTRLGPVARLVTPSDIKQEANSLLAAFRLNLTALSLISVLVGFFLVYATTYAAVSRRRHEFGVLRSLGTSRSQIVGLILGEVMLLGVLGVALGIPAGIAVANAGVTSVSATLTNLYLLEAIESVRVDAPLIFLAIGVGLGGALAGALVPAMDLWRSGTTDLLRKLRAGNNPEPSLRGPIAAVLIGTLSVTWYQIVGYRWAPSGFVLCVVIVVCLVLITPYFVSRVGRNTNVRSFGFRYALRSMTANIGSVSIAVTSLSVAVTMLVGVTLMVLSFRVTLEDWITTAVRADVYVSSTSWRGRTAESALTEEMVARLTTQPGVQFHDRVSGFRGRVAGRNVAIAGVEFGEPEGKLRFRLQAGSYDGVFDAPYRSILISEPLARKSGLAPHDSVEVETPIGPAQVQVAGIYFDYGNEQGAIATSYGFVVDHFGISAPTGIALYFEPGANAEEIHQTLDAQFAGLPVEFRGNRNIREQAMDVFDQTFAITALLQSLSLAIAAIGVTLALLVSARERLAELALYRALGATRRQIFKVFVGCGLNISIHGILLGSAGGVALAWVLINIINPNSFGWTIQASWSPTPLIFPLITVIAAAGLASIYPALRAARVPATELTHDDA